MTQTLTPRPAEEVGGRRGVRSPSARIGWLLLAALAVAGTAVLSVAIGSLGVGWSDIVGGVTGSIDTVPEAAVYKRVPRTVLAILAGAGLGLAGAVMQGITRNPLADPGILGVNSGAALAVVCGIAFLGLATPTAFIVAAVLGAGVTAVAVYAIASLGRGGATPLKLALAGVASTAALSSLVSAVLLPRNDVASSFRLWQIGGVGGVRMDSITTVLPYLALGFVICLLSGRALNSLALGDELAAGLGQRVAVVRGLGALGAVLLCGAITAVAGPIGFVGLVVPHVCRLLIGSDHRWLLPLSALLGAALLTGTDVIGRVVAPPQEIDVGIITALIGAPVFIAIVRRRKIREL